MKLINFLNKQIEFRNKLDINTIFHNIKNLKFF